MSTRAHAEVVIRYTPNDAEIETIEVYGLEAPALSRWPGDPYDRTTIERLLRTAFALGLDRLFAEIDGEGFTEQEVGSHDHES